MINERSLANLKPAQKNEIKNPNGKKPGTKNYKTMLESILNTKIKHDEKTKTTFEHIADKLIKKCLEGNDKALQLLFNKIFGGSTILENDSGKIQINIIRGKDTIEINGEKIDN
jgi:hypothetical protein